MENSLNNKEKETLLKLARQVLSEKTLEGKVRENIEKDFEITEVLKQNSGVFVTLKIQGQLRGCIGYIEPIKPLYQAVIENSINACSRDPRFSPVTESELSKIDLEISALSPPESIPDPDHFEVGTHGIILKQGSYSAVFLPQVAPEQGWDREETLRHLSQKAGLSKNAWKEKGTTFKVFTAQVFHEDKQ